MPNTQAAPDGWHEGDRPVGGLAAQPPPPPADNHLGHAQVGPAPILVLKGHSSTNHVANYEACSRAQKTGDAPHFFLQTKKCARRLRELRIDDGNGASTISCSVLGGFLEGYAAQLPALTSLHVCGLHPKDRLHGLRQLLQCLGEQ